MLFNCHSYHFPHSYHSPDSISPASQKHLYSHIQTEKQTSVPHELKAELKKPSTSTGKTYSVIHFCLLHHTQTAHDKTERDERFFLCSQTAYSPNNKSYCFSTTSAGVTAQTRPLNSDQIKDKIWLWKCTFAWLYQFWKSILTLLSSLFHDDKQMGLSELKTSL